MNSSENLVGSHHLFDDVRRILTTRVELEDHVASGMTRPVVALDYGKTWDLDLAAFVDWMRAALSVVILTREDLELWEALLHLDVASCMIPMLVSRQDVVDLVHLIEVDERHDFVCLGHIYEETLASLIVVDKVAVVVLELRNGYYGE